MCDVISFPAILSIIGRHFKLCRYVNCIDLSMLIILQPTPECESVFEKQPALSRGRRKKDIHFVIVKLL